MGPGLFINPALIILLGSDANNWQFDVQPGPETVS
jgi:hypothetical protein